MKTLLALLLLIPSLSWGEKIAFMCSGLDGYFVINQNLLSTKMSLYRNTGTISYYKKTEENDVFIFFELQKIDTKEDDLEKVKSLIIKLDSKDPLRYNKLTKNLSRDDEVYNCYPYDLNE